MKLTSQISSATSRMPTYCPANTVLRLILRSANTDPAALGHLDGPVMERVLRHLRVGVFTRGRCVHLARVLAAQCLVRSVIVVTLNEFIKAALLLQKVVTGWFGGLLLERQMHAFMAPILLRMTRLDTFNGDAESQPPYRKRLRPNSACGTSKGTPLSVRIAAGRPNSLKTRSNTGNAPASWSTPGLHRPAGSVTGRSVIVSG